MANPPTRLSAFLSTACRLRAEEIGRPNACLVHRERQGTGLSELAHQVEPVSRERLLEDIDACTRELANDATCLWQAEALVRVGPDKGLGPGCLTHRASDGNIGRWRHSGL